MHLTKLLTLILALSVSALTALASGTIVLTPWATVDGGVGSGAIYGLAIDGTNAYCQLGLNNLVQIVRIADVGGANIRTQLVAPTTWTTASGGSSCTSFQGFDVSGDYLQFGDVTSDAIWRVNKYTGLLIRYCSKQAISNFTGRSTVAVVAQQCVNPANGEHVFFDSTSSKVLTTDGSNVVSLVFNESDATNALGVTATLSGGMNFDNASNLYFGTSGGFLAKRDAAGNFSVVFSKAVLTNITRVLSASSFGAMKMGPNGLFAFRNGSGTAGALLQFDPADPNNTLSVFAGTNALLSSVAANANLNCNRYFGTYPNGGWAWHQFGLNGIYLTMGGVTDFKIALSTSDYSTTSLTWNNGTTKVLACTNEVYTDVLTNWFALANNAASPWVDTSASNYPVIYYRAVSDSFTSQYDVGKCTITLKPGTGGDATYNWIAPPLELFSNTVGYVLGSQLNYDETYFDILKAQSTIGSDAQIDTYYFAGTWTDFDTESTRFATGRGCMLVVDATHTQPKTVAFVGKVPTAAVTNILSAPSGSDAVYNWIGAPSPALRGFFVNALTNPVVTTEADANFDLYKHQTTIGADAQKDWYYINGLWDDFESGTALQTPGMGGMLILNAIHTGANTTWAAPKTR